MYSNTPSTPLKKEEIKFRLIEHLKRNPRTQIANILAFGIEQPVGRSLTTQESHMALELIHEFTATNIVMPAADRDNAGWPWISVTTHGQEVLGASGPPVYDYDGYMTDLKARVPDLDGVVERYVGESLRTYQGNSYLASMAMLGCASERAMRVLFNAYLGAIDKKENRDRLRSRID